MQEIITCASNLEAFSNKEILDIYCKAVRSAVVDQDYGPLKYFKWKYEEAFRHFSAVNRKRTAIHRCYEAMKCTKDKIYFGTLTFNNAKNLNKRKTKLKEAFTKLNIDFDYVVLVEECGCDKGRYHIHFLGVFKKDHNFQSFVSHWHSRQNLIEVYNGDVAKYMCKYLVKDLPRIRKNKKLVQLIANHKKVKKAIHHTLWTEKEEPKAAEDIVYGYYLDYGIELPF